MPHTYQIFVDGAPLDDVVYTSLISLEVEENVELPSAFQLTLPVATDSSSDLTYVNDANFRAFANLAVVVTVEGLPSECIFDGYVLSHKLHLDRGTTKSTLAVWGQDSSFLMNLEEKAKEWIDVSDAAVASSIFGDYGIADAPENTEDDSPTHTEAGHTLMQRATDIQFLRQLARRNGKLCRVSSGSEPGKLTGYFAKPKLDGEAVLTLTLNDPERFMVNAFDFEWDVTRPSQVAARQALFSDDDPDGAVGDSADAGLPLLSDRGLADFSGKTSTVMLTAPVDDAGELALRAAALLAEAAFFVKCSGEADLSAVGAVLRVGTVVELAGVGSAHSGKYYVWSVRHAINASEYKMSFVLMRNAIGPLPAAAGGPLGGLL